MTEIVYAILFGVGAIAIQLLFSLVVKKRIFFGVPTLGFALLGGILILLAKQQNDWSALAYLVLAIYAWCAAGCTLVTLLTVELVRAVQKRLKKKK